MVVRRSPARRRANATVEFAVVLAFVLIPLLIGTWELCRVAEYQQLASNAAREGARRASSGQINTSQAAQVAFDYLRRANIPVANAKVLIENVTSGQSIQYSSTSSVDSGVDWDLTQSTQNDQLRLTVTVPYDDLSWSQLNPIYAGSMLTARTTWWSLRDKDFPSLADPPIE
jgi:Flp pilus assembly protein TadG